MATHEWDDSLPHFWRLVHKGEYAAHVYSPQYSPRDHIVFNGVPRGYFVGVAWDRYGYNPIVLGHYPTLDEAKTVVQAIVLLGEI